MPAPLYGADDPRRCSGNSVSEVLDKFRKKLRPDNVSTAGNERGKGISPLHMACRERRARANLPGINPTIPQSHIYPLP